MHEKLTKCPNFTGFCPKNIFPEFVGMPPALVSYAYARFGVSGKPMKNYIILHNNVGLVSKVSEDMTPNALKISPLTTRLSNIV